ncbi:WXG100 family type VII secretion target [Streptomyces sp. NPDC048566]|uniref:WXG100 family type VII secretion target n=1 Tax=Streptomyces sp. NPDC048566 TaxID=3365569 RepID=UPI00372143D3
MAGGKDADITYDKMRHAAKKLGHEKEKMEDKLHALDSYIDGLVADGYTTSKGSQAFDDSFKDFTRGMKETLKGLQGMAKFIEDAAKAYEELDIQLANGVKGS